MESFRNTAEFEFSIRLVDELFDRVAKQDITQTNVGEVPKSSFRAQSSFLTNTMLVMERLSGHPEFRVPVAGDLAAPYGRFRNRHVIGTGTRVLGGVFLGHVPREALVVDVEDAWLQKKFLQFMHARFANLRSLYLRGELDIEMTVPGLSRAFAQALPEALFAFTRTCLTYDETRVARLFREKQLELDAEFSLDHYLAAGTGVCRHMILFLVAMFELLEKKSLTIGRMFLCRCYIPHMFSHAWARHEAIDHPILILDPAQNFLGPLEEGGEMGKFIYDHEYAKILSS